MSLLKALGVTSGYGETEILHEVSIELQEKEIVSIIGPNGAGKSTLLKTLFGIITPKKGHITLHDDEISGLSTGKIVRKGMCYLPQVESVFPSLTVHENFEMGAFTRTDNYQDKIKEVYDLFPLLGDRKKQKAERLSGGMRQMVAIGIALMGEPKVLLLDEPSAGLAPMLVRMIFEKIVEIHRSGVSLMLVEENARETLKICHRGYLLVTGRILLEDTGLALLNNEDIGRLYLGG